MNNNTPYNMQKTVRSIEKKKELNTRLNKIVGQVEGIKKMIDDNRYCADVLIQLKAVEKSIKSLEALIFEDHMNCCIKNSFENGDLSKVDEIIDLFRRF